MSVHQPIEEIPTIGIRSTTSRPVAVQVAWNWDIQGFGLMNAKVILEARMTEYDIAARRLYSPYPLTLGDVTTTWCLEFDISYSVQEDTNFVGLFLTLRDAENHWNHTGLTFLTRFKIMVMDSAGETLKEFDCPSATFGENISQRTYGCREFVDVKSIFNKSLKYLDDDIFHIRLDLTILEDSRTVTHAILYNPSLPQSEYINQLTEIQTEYAKLLESKASWDIVIECGGKRFEVHSAVLVARSNVFLRMLETEMKEKLTRNIFITDFEPATIEILIKYLYTYDVGQINLAECRELVRAADKYELLKLKKLCFDRLERDSPLDDIGEVIVLAYLHSADKKIRKSLLGRFEKNWTTLSKLPAIQEQMEKCLKAFFRDEEKDEPDNQMEYDYIDLEDNDSRCLM